MIRATSVLPAGSWTGAVADTVLLDFEARHRRRLAMSGRGGVSFLLDLPITMALHPGDGLVLDDGRIVAVEAATERLVDISAGSAALLVHVAWQIGSRHLPTQFLGDYLRIQPIPDIEGMLAGLGATLHRVEAPFDPEIVPRDADDSPWSSFWQGFGGQPSDDPAFGHSTFAQGDGYARPGERAEGWSSFYRTGPAFSKAHGKSFSTGGATGGRRQSHSWSESHAQSPGRDHPGSGHREGARRTRGEGGDPNPDDPSSRQG